MDVGQIPGSSPTLLSNLLLIKCFVSSDDLCLNLAAVTVWWLIKVLPYLTWKHQKTSVLINLSVNKQLKSFIFLQHPKMFFLSNV